MLFQLHFCGIFGINNSKKAAIMAMITRFFRDPGQNFFLFGPRGTGKSTWLKQTYPQALYLDLLDPRTERELSSRPEELIALVEAGASSRITVIDEIQKIPTLLDVVHLLIEKHPEKRFVLTGSSARKLKRAGVDLLAGRAITRTMHPFMAAELGTSFDMISALLQGMVPLIHQSSNPAETLNAFIALYVKEEVQAESLVRNVGAFHRFLEAATFSHGGVLNITEISRECQVHRKTVQGFLEILEDLLLAFRVPVFSRRAKRKLIAHPKFYFFDAGVFRTLRPTGPIDTSQEIDGPALEGLVAQHLRAWLAYRGERGELFFWRTRSGVEVDFVLYGENLFAGIEVKNSTRIHGKMLKGLKTFQTDHPEARCIMLYRGSHPKLVDGILCLPCDEFLQGLDPDVPLWRGEQES
jgi:predicted AAA+ superfamily ATPase